MAATITDIGACVFDAYGTLFDVHTITAKCREALGDKADTLSTLWRRKQLEYTWLRSLMGRHVPFWQVTADALDHALDTVGINDRTLHNRLMQLYLTIDCYPEVPDTLRHLNAAGLPCAILSNGSPQMLQAGVETAGLAPLLTALLSVEAVGLFKPHPSVYQLAVDRLGVPAPRICFLSSNAWDAAGAAAFGFRVVWINRFDQVPERLGLPPQDEIRTLDQLLPLVGIRPAGAG